jgi:CSLREA domain-containing protein
MPKTDHRSGKEDFQGDTAMKSFPKRILVPLAAALIGALLAACGGGSTTLTVNTADDTYEVGGCSATHCSLREAISKANTLAGPTTIGFNIGGGGVQTIRPTSGLPFLTRPMTIDGSTQPGYSSTPLIELDGSLALPNVVYPDGLVVQGGDTIIRALAINRFLGNGIRVAGADGNKILGCYIGTDPTGTVAAGNGTAGGDSAGIILYEGDSNVIGGTGKYEGNLISGNLDAGIRILTSSNSVLRNLIGTAAGGASALGNQGNGILVAGGMNKIGGAGARNVISGNVKNGVSISSPTNSVKGNWIGLNAAGAAALPNHQNGVFVGGNITQIGGPASGEGNVISGNLIDGIQINADSVEVTGNYIGTNSGGAAAVGNQRNGVFIMSQGGTLIGGADAGAGNLISGNGIVGVWIENGSNEVTVWNNRIGTNAAGTAAVKNIKSGLHVSGTNHQIGSSGMGNVISGNGGAGIAVVAPATEIKIQDNKIGTDPGGTFAVGNDIGIEIGLTNGPYSVLIGGSLYGEGNLISGNLAQGLLLYDNAQVYGNRIGMDQGGLNELPNGGDGILVKGDNNRIGDPHEPNSIAHNGGHGVAVITESGSAAGNSISGNSIWDNAGLGIALGGNLVVPNDPGDTDTGDNNLQNDPVMVTAVHDPGPDETALTATLDSAPASLYMVEFFVNTSCDLSGSGEGEQMVASLPVTTDAAGHADVTATFEPAHFIPGGFITATATDSTLNTSQFSNCIPITEKDAATATPQSPMSFEPFVNPLEIFYGNCEPNAVLITVQIDNPPAPISYVLFFARLMEKGSSAKSTWMDAVNMTKAGDNRWSYNLSVYDLPDYKSHVEAWLQYQFVVYDAAQKKIGMSVVYGNVTVKRCGRGPNIAG